MMARRESAFFNLYFIPNICTLTALDSLGPRRHQLSTGTGPRNTGRTFPVARSGDGLVLTAYGRGIGLGCRDAAWNSCRSVWTRESSNIPTKSNRKQRSWRDLRVSFPVDVGIIRLCFNALVSLWSPLASPHCSLAPFNSIPVPATARNNMATLFWSPTSPYVRKVVLALRELGLEGIIATKIHGEANPTLHSTSHDINPSGKIPALVLDEGQRPIFGSQVIVQRPQASVACLLAAHTSLDSSNSVRPFCNTWTVRLLERISFLQQATPAGTTSSLWNLSRMASSTPRS